MRPESITFGSLLRVSKSGVTSRFSDGPNSGICVLSIVPSSPSQLAADRRFTPKKKEVLTIFWDVAEWEVAAAHCQFFITPKGLLWIEQLFTSFHVQLVILSNFSHRPFVECSCAHISLLLLYTKRKRFVMLFFISSCCSLAVTTTTTTTGASGFVLSLIEEKSSVLLFTRDD